MGRYRFPHTCTALHVLALTLAVPAAAAAQEARRGPDLPRVDVVGLVGWSGAQVDDLPFNVYRDWDSTGVAGLGVGFYATEYLKFEGEFSGSGTRELYGSFQQFADRNVTRYIYQEHRVRTRTLSVTGLYQFLHNSWVHPFAGVGVDVDWERRMTESRIRTQFSGPPFTSTEESLPDTTERDERVRVALMTGAKLYVTQRTFIRSDVRVAFGRSVTGVRWRFGAGVDF
jgi:opacity protein-like surface antigen